MTKATLRAIAVLGTLFAALSENVVSAGPDTRPSILFAISDDQSWLHTAVCGDKVVNTPNFDRVAKGGVLFTHAFAAAASCTPSRAAILTGQHVWRLKEAANLMGSLRAEFEVYPDLVEQAGELDNTLVVVTSDQGMATLHGKGTLYDLGTGPPRFT